MRPGSGLLLAVGMFFLGLVATETFAAKSSDTITDETIRESFTRSESLHSSHEVMMAQQHRLHEILDGFLMGDVDKINRSVDDLVGAMQAVVRMFPSETDPEKETAAWQAMSGIVQRARYLQSEMKNQNYQKAYNHYMLINEQCLQCHQAVRSWGHLPEPPPPAEEAAETQNPQEKESRKEEKSGKEKQPESKAKRVKK